MGLCLPSLSEETLQGFKYFRLLGPLLAHLHRTATGGTAPGTGSCSMISMPACCCCTF